MIRSRLDMARRSGQSCLQVGFRAQLFYVKAATNMVNLSFCQESTCIIISRHALRFEPNWGVEVK